MMIKIERGVPMPERRSHYVEYRDFEVGQSLVRLRKKGENKFVVANRLRAGATQCCLRAGLKRRFSVTYKGNCLVITRVK